MSLSDRDGDTGVRTGRRVGRLTVKGRLMWRHELSVPHGPSNAVTAKSTSSHDDVVTTNVRSSFFF